MKVCLKIDYFKPSGKWYSEGDLEVEVPLHEGTDMPNGYELRKKLIVMQANGQAPGLTSGREFVWVVRATNVDGFAPIMLPSLVRW